jgi:hypothetical protein
MKTSPELGSSSKIRIGVGLHHLLTPGLGASAFLGARLDARARLVARVLGARYLFQAVASGTRPSAAVLALGAEVDGAHAASMLLLALLNRHRRREALTSSLIAAGFAFAGVRAAVDAPRLAVGGSATIGVAGRRDELADRVARSLVPGYPWAARRAEPTGAVDPLRWSTTALHEQPRGTR